MRHTPASQIAPLDCVRGGARHRPVLGWMALTALVIALVPGCRSGASRGREKALRERATRAAACTAALEHESALSNAVLYSRSLLRQARALGAPPAPAARPARRTAASLRAAEHFLDAQVTRRVKHAQAIATLQLEALEKKSPSTARAYSRLVDLHTSAVVALSTIRNVVLSALLEARNPKVHVNVVASQRSIDQAYCKAHAAVIKVLDAHRCHALLKGTPYAAWTADELPLPPTRFPGITWVDVGLPQCAFGAAGRPADCVKRLRQRPFLPQCAPRPAVR